MKILLIKVGAAGDVIRTSSIALALQRKYPHAKIVWATEKESVALFDFENIIAVDVKSIEWEKEKYDWVINLEDDLRFCHIASFIHAAKKSGAMATELGKKYYSSDLSEWFSMGLLNPDRQQANSLKKANRRTFFEIMYDGLGLDQPTIRPRINYTKSDKWDGFEGLRNCSTKSTEI